MLRRRDKFSQKLALMDNEINLRYQLSENELLSAMRAQSMRTWSFRFLIVFIVVMLVLAGVQVMLMNSPLDETMVLLAPIALVLVVLAAFTYFNPIMRYRIRKEPKYITEQIWRFSEDSVHWKTAYSESTSGWKSYARVVESKNFYSLFLQSNMFTPIPKRAFANAEEESRFRELLKRKISTWG